MSDPLELLKKDILNKDQPILVKQNGEDYQEIKDINEATHLSLQNQKIKLDLNQETKFKIDDKPIDLRAVAYSWLNKDLSAADLLTDSQVKNIQTLTFLQRSDLINWLSGESNESEFIQNDNTNLEKDQDSSQTNSTINDDPQLIKILNNERHLINHNTALRGSKPVDFSSVGRECEIKIVKVLKRKGTNPTKSTSTSKDQEQDPIKKKRRQNPIILISPAASALLQINNIKAFFDESKFVNPMSKDPNDQDLLNFQGDLRNITHTFPKIGKQTFLIVNNTDKFTKAEYWDRVVAVFTTGQQWQFKTYKWTDPQQLFQKIKGFFFHFNGDSIPQQVNEWNVEQIGLDKTRRFKDIEVLNHFWDSLEKSMLAKGWN
ncbi:Cell division control protein [Wickerhamomyces ciferrii]|uniref:Cell division control protein n=1 Tax=Wickerhamomyces ciferrii (strain ATCC 14091 / BCRC 22168 / CBS 111 / JCM 3599 / NBRC 0793 / NRRL Y-1031 F-60-10) TaxID=1206466 RepID=K0K6A7_WICCF|nr:Cell division control protein [Wickerhamomyces ciferrii]CCH40475.1 Cell division control protein [Wickerhamomyces ciferrii]